MDLTLMTQLRSQSAQVFDDWARVPIRVKEVDDGPPPRNTPRIRDRVTPCRCLGRARATWSEDRRMSPALSPHPFKRRRQSLCRKKSCRTCQTLFSLPDPAAAA